MQPHQQRVVDEKTELEEKIEKLIAFKNTEIFASLPANEQNLLGQQMIYMSGYSNVLGQRIAAF